MIFTEILTSIAIKDFETVFPDATLFQVLFLLMKAYIPEETPPTVINYDKNFIVEGYVEKRKVYKGLIIGMLVGTILEFLSNLKLLNNKYLVFSYCNS